MALFTGSGFRLETVSPYGLATLRVRFTQDPLLTTGFYGALNIDNYEVTGPGINYITGASAVVSDPQAVDLYLAAPLELGAWVLATTNIRFENGTNVLLAPTSLPFTVARSTIQEAVPGGAVNDDVVNVLRKFFNPSLKGPNWDAILEGLAAGDRTNWDNAKLAFDQLYIASASGTYLDRRASDQGIRRPPTLAMEDSLFRELAILSKTRKLTQDAILEVLEVFYGSDAVRANMTTALQEPFALEDGDSLQLLIDERDWVSVLFDRSQFSRIGQATAVEVAAAISRRLHAARSLAYAVARMNEEGEYEVRLYSGRLGISSAVRVLGGKAQTALWFTSGETEPDYIFPVVGITPFARWDITFSSVTAGNIRFTLDGTSTTFTDFDEIMEGDKVLIYGAEFNAANQGTFDVEAVGIEYPGPVQWFEVQSEAGVEQANVDQVTYPSLQFHRSRKRTIYNEPRHVLVSQAEGKVDVIIPATTQAVHRTPGTAAYGILPDPVELVELRRGFNPAYGGEHVIATTSAPHGLEVGDWVLIENAFPTIPVPPRAIYTYEHSEILSTTVPGLTTSETVFQGYGPLRYTVVPWITLPGTELKVGLAGRFAAGIYDVILRVYIGGFVTDEGTWTAAAAKVLEVTLPANNSVDLALLSAVFAKPSGALGDYAQMFVTTQAVGGTSSLQLLGPVISILPVTEGRGILLSDVAGVNFPTPTEAVRREWLVNFDIFADAGALTIGVVVGKAEIYVDTDAYYRVRLGGTAGLADGTLVAEVHTTPAWPAGSKWAFGSETVSSSLTGWQRVTFTTSGNRSSFANVGIVLREAT